MSNWYYPYYQPIMNQPYRQYNPYVSQSQQPLRQPYGSHFAQFRPIRPSAQDTLILPRGYNKVRF